MEIANIFTKTEKITKIAIIVAMAVEADSIISSLKMTKLENFFDKRLPLIAFQTNDEHDVLLVINGKCPIYGVDRIGTQAATLASWETIRIFNPDLIISAGTAGGFKNKEAKIGDVYVGTNSFKYHNRHIPVTDFEEFQIGNYKCVEAPNMAKKLGLKQGIISTGDSVFTVSEDLERMKMINSECKEMEAAAIAEIAHICNIPMMGLKVITDFVDSEEKTHQQFLKNYHYSIQILSEKIKEVISFIYGKNINEI